MKILFICKNNQFRSQMAAALFNALTGTHDASSAGTHVGTPDVPEGALIEKFFHTKDFFELMEKHGIHIRTNRTRKLTPEMLTETDTVVSMAEEPFIPDFLRKAPDVIWWNVENPSIATKEISEKIFAQIYALINKLIHQHYM